MTKYIECWGADKPFANITESTMAKNIGLAVSIDPRNIVDHFSRVVNHTLSNNTIFLESSNDRIKLTTVKKHLFRFQVSVCIVQHKRDTITSL